MKRREFMGTVATLALGAAWSSAASGSRAAEVTTAMIDDGAVDEVGALADRLLQAFPQPRSLQVIGDAYRRGQTGSASAFMHIAFQDILRHLDLSGADLQQMTPAAIRTCVDARTAGDFSEGRIIGVDGWLLGETEARLCEVAALRMG